MNRRSLILAVAVAATLPLAGPARADLAASKALVDRAKAQGLVGEQADGYLGFVRAANDPALSAAVQEINAGRRQAYQEVAQKTGTPVEAAAEATGKTLVAKTPPGQFHKPLGGSWLQK
jgi:uncharacterized protein